MDLHLLKITQNTSPIIYQYIDAHIIKNDTLILSQLLRVVKIKKKMAKHFYHM